MKFTCTNCRLGYRIPDKRVLDAGESGLRIRCKRCRAVLVVNVEMAEPEDDTRPDLPRLVKRRSPPRPRRKSAFDSTGLPAMTEIHEVEAPGPLPAALAADGSYSAIPGVRRDVTGVFLEKADKKTGRIWYAALRGRPRGPFTEREMKLLASKGRVRGRTLVWRPGFDEWKRIRNGGDEVEELDWIRDAVIARKRREQRAVDKARLEHGIHTIVLDNDERPKAPPPIPATESTPPHHAAVEGMPPISTGAFLSLERGAFKRRRRVLIAAGLWVTLALVAAAYTLPWWLEK